MNYYERYIDIGMSSDHVMGEIVPDSEDESLDAKFASFNQGPVFSSSDNEDGTDQDSMEQAWKKSHVTPTKQVSKDLPSYLRQGEIVQVKQFDLGKSFDSQLSNKVAKLNFVTDLIKTTPVKKLSSTVHLKMNRSKENLMTDLVKQDLSDKVIDMIINENISNKFKDWHFIRYGCSDELDSTDLQSLVRSMGCVEASEISDEDIEKYDTYCDLLPSALLIHEVEQFLFKHADDNEESKTHNLRFFICFILDRNIYESVEMDSVRCSWIHERIIQGQYYNRDSTEFLKQYLNVTHRLSKGKYFMHYRFTKLIPSLKDPLVEHLFESDSKIVEEFNRLFDLGKYESLLYFILFVYGSALLPYGKENSATTSYFHDCIYDMSTSSVNDVELSIIKSILNIFGKIINN